MGSEGQAHLSGVEIAGGTSAEHDDRKRRVGSANPDGEAQAKRKLLQWVSDMAEDLKLPGLPLLCGVQHRRLDEAFLRAEVLVQRGDRDVRMQGELLDRCVGAGGRDDFFCGAQVAGAGTKHVRVFSTGLGSRHRVLLSCSSTEL